MLVNTFLKRALNLYPDKPAVFDDSKVFTYREYGERINSLSNALTRDLKLEKGERVAFLTYNSHHLLEAYYGVVNAGLVLVPLNIRLSPVELAYILNDVEAQVLVFDYDFFPLVDEMIGQITYTKKFIVINQELLPCPWPAVDIWAGYEELLANAPSVFQPPELEENEVAEIFYTSGTTGKPKGVMLSHRNLWANACNFIISVGLTDSDVQLHTIPLFHVNGWGIPHALTGMGGVHIMLKRFDPEIVCQLIQQHKVTLACTVPTMMNILLNFKNLDNYNLSSLSRIIVGGAASPQNFAEKVQKELKCTYIGSYGLTEASPVLTMATIKDHLKSLPVQHLYRLQTTGGLPVMGAEIKVINEHGQEVDHNGTEIGEVVARGDMVMKGYWKLPEETARTIVNGWLHTGDMAVVYPEGYIRIVDRQKDIIISGGENISSVEIEEALYDHPAVLECAVIPVTDENWGEVPKAFVVLKAEKNTSESELIEHCRQKLARFKVPKSIAFIESLPKTGTGKIQKSLLKQQYLLK